MDLNTIKYLSSRFRRGIEVAYEKRLFRKLPFSDFPNACCGDAPELLAQYLMDNDPNQSIRCKTVYGTYRYDNFENFFGHSWLVVDGAYIVDITADQSNSKIRGFFRKMRLNLVMWESAVTFIPCLKLNHSNAENFMGCGI